MFNGISKIMFGKRSHSDEDLRPSDSNMFVDLENHDSVPDYGGKRSTLPATMVQRGQISIWSILKQSVGKELSKVTMPVVFNEPLSFLQRLTEYLEYYDILKQAAQETDPLKRLELVAAFAVSALASNWERVGKPFNPLLGETYELDRLEDLGFRWISEQVSHHPPVSAFYADGPDFKFHGSIYPKLRFWGRSVEIQPKGVVTLELTKMKDVYTWSNVSCSVHNLVMGTPFIEQHGTMDIISHTNKLTCSLNFKASNSWMNKDSTGHHIEGFIVDEKGHRLKALYGVWTNFFASVDPQIFERHFPNWGKERKARLASANDAIKRTPSAPPLSSKSMAASASLDDEANSPNDNCNSHYDHNINPHDNVAVPTPTPSIPVLAESNVLWKVKTRPKGNEQYYHFTSFAMMLNEALNDHKLPPTDCRLRPDIRCLEHGDLDGAASAKNRLEEKQREAQAKRKKSKIDWHPLWFRYEKHPHVNEEAWIFTNEYWSKRWSKCPDIF